jgi:hypothetical protein
MQRTSEESEKPGRLLGSFVSFEQSTLSGHRQLGHHLGHRYPRRQRHPSARRRSNHASHGRRPSRSHAAEYSRTGTSRAAAVRGGTTIRAQPRTSASMVYWVR